MAKQPVIEETEDGGVAIELTPRKERKFKGSDDAPVDAETGESVFDDLSPRFNKKLDEAAAKESGAAKEDEEETGDLEIQDEGDEQQQAADADESEETDESEDSDTVDEVDDTDEVEERRPGKKNKFEKRLDRANRLVEETRAESAILRQRLDAQESTAKAQADEAKYNTEKSKLTGDLDKARTEYRAAIEAGDTDAQVAANEKIADAKGDLKVLEVRYGDARLQLEQSKTSGSTLVKTKSDQWIRKHGRYNTDKEFAATARTVDQQVSAAGFNPETDEYYKELDKRMSKFYPKEFKGGRVTEVIPPRRKHPASGLRRDEGGAAPSTKKKTVGGNFEMKNGRVMLTPRHIKTMRDFNMDPTNPNDVRDFVEQNR